MECSQELIHTVEDFTRKRAEQQKKLVAVVWFVYRYSLLNSDVEMVISMVLIPVAKMPTYVLLINWTDQGIRTAKDSRKRVQDFENAVGISGGKMVDAYYTMGQYDFVVTVEFPNDESAMSILLALGERGNVRTTTLKAFSLSEAEKILLKLP